MVVVQPPPIVTTYDISVVSIAGRGSCIKVVSQREVLVLVTCMEPSPRLLLIILKYQF